MVLGYFGVLFVAVIDAILIAQGSSSSTILLSVTSVNSNSSVMIQISSTPPLSPIPAASTSALFNNSVSVTVTPVFTSTYYVNSTMAPTTTPSTKPPTKRPIPHEVPTKGRSFDGASFFGGIILGVVLAIAGFVAFTWWQNKRKSYHSL